MFPDTFFTFIIVIVSGQQHDTRVSVLRTYLSGINDSSSNTYLLTFAYEKYFVAALTTYRHE